MTIKRGDPAYNWASTGPAGCDSHCIEFPCGPCRLESDRPEPVDRDEHECNEAGSPDIDLCSDCKEHASFCSECGLSSCCGAGEYACD